MRGGSLGRLGRSCGRCLHLRLLRYLTEALQVKTHLCLHQLLSQVWYGKLLDVLRRRSADVSVHAGCSDGGRSSFVCPGTGCDAIVMLVIAAMISVLKA